MRRLFLFGILFPVALLWLGSPVATGEQSHDETPSDAPRAPVPPPSLWIAGTWQVLTEAIEPTQLPEDLPVEMRELVKQLVGDGVLFFDVEEKTVEVTNLPRIATDSRGHYEERWQNERDEQDRLTYHGTLSVRFDDERSVTFHVSLRHGEQNHMRLRYDGLPVSELPLRHVPVGEDEFDPAKPPEYLLGTWEWDLDYMLEHYDWVRDQLGGLDPEVLRADLPRTRITETAFYAVRGDSEERLGEYRIDRHDAALLLVSVDPDGPPMTFRMLFLDADRIRIGESTSEEVQVWRRYVPDEEEEEESE